MESQEKEMNPKIRFLLKFRKKMYVQEVGADETLSKCWIQMRLKIKCLSNRAKIINKIVREKNAPGNRWVQELDADETL